MKGSPKNYFSKPALIGIVSVHNCRRSLTVLTATSLTGLKRVKVECIFNTTFNLRKCRDGFINFICEAFFNHLTKIIYQLVNLIVWKCFKHRVHCYEIIKIDARFRGDFFKLCYKLVIKAFNATIRKQFRDVLPSCFGGFI